jgi:hypothetical protein
MAGCLLENRYNNICDVIEARNNKKLNVEDSSHQGGSGWMGGYDIEIGQEEHG